MNMHEESQAVVDKQYLGKVSAARFEAETFMSRHPEYFITPANGTAITDFVAEKNLILTAENFEYAFEKLKEQGKLLPAREALATMTSTEFQRFAKTHGRPVTDDRGHVSYELPEVYLKEPTESYNRPRTSRYTEATLPRHPEDAHRKITKKEFNSWGADRMKEYLQMIGAWGGPLPDHLK
jgi:hypothetical protein